MLKILGYSDKISVVAGDSIRFFVHCEEPCYKAQLVKIRSGDINPEGPGLKTEKIPCNVNGEFQGKEQKIYIGSYAVIPVSENQFEFLQSFENAFGIEMYFYPTTPNRGTQVLLDFYDEQGISITLTPNGLIEFKAGNETISTEAPLVSHLWYKLNCVFQEGVCSLRLEALDHYHRHLNQNIHKKCSFTRLKFPKRPIFFAGQRLELNPSRQVGQHIYNGKLDAISFYEPSGKTIAAWDFSKDIPSIDVLDTEKMQFHGVLENLPTRGVTGWRYSGEAMSWVQFPDQYSAIHFHDDDLYDARWEESFSFDIPVELKSGLYAMCLSLADQDEYIPFVVRPAPSHQKNPVVVLFPSATYMAYANEHVITDAAIGEHICQRTLQIQAHQAFLHEHREYGSSLYDSHSDGSGVHYSSRMRPVLNMRPKVLFSIGAGSSFLWQFNADTHILDWLEAQDIPYDMVTDDDLEAHGVQALENHRVVITTTHPEYYSTNMYQALEDFIHRKGRLMYMGGNGFYWRIAYHQSLPGVIEVRRTAGTRAWETAPGEGVHSFTGESGGLWRYQNRSPNKLCGIGFAAQGFDHSSYYRCTQERHNPRAKFIFENVEDEIIGDFGLIGGGAAGMEIDRFDPHLGSPRHALVVASSEKHTAAHVVAVEDIFNNYLGTDGEQNSLVRADATFFETPSGGAVFSTGSISWCGSLWHNNYKNNISQITLNVIKRFIDPKPFPYPFEES